MTPEEIQDLEVARNRLFNATTELCENELTRSDDGETPNPRPERVRELIDEMRQALSIIVLIAGPEGSLHP